MSLYLVLMLCFTTPPGSCTYPLTGNDEKKKKIEMLCYSVTKSRLRGNWKRKEDKGEIAPPQSDETLSAAFANLYMKILRNPTITSVVHTKALSAVSFPCGSRLLLTEYNVVGIVGLEFVLIRVLADHRKIAISVFINSPTHNRIRAFCSRRTLCRF